MVGSVRVAVHGLELAPEELSVPEEADGLVGLLLHPATSSLVGPARARLQLDLGGENLQVVEVLGQLAQELPLVPLGLLGRELLYHDLAEVGVLASGLALLLVAQTLEVAQGEAEDRHGNTEKNEHRV